MPRKKAADDVQLSHVPTLNAYFSIYKYACSPQRNRVKPCHSRGPIENRAIKAAFTRTSRFSYYVITARSPILCTRVHGRLSDDGFRIIHACLCIDITACWGGLRSSYLNRLQLVYCGTFERTRLRSTIRTLSSVGRSITPFD
jgi:hypothetical protein